MCHHRHHRRNWTFFFVVILNRVILAYHMLGTIIRVVDHCYLEFYIILCYRTPKKNPFSFNREENDIFRARAIFFGATHLLAANHS